mgnify:CR=1 FL=1
MLREIVALPLPAAPLLLRCHRQQKETCVHVNVLSALPLQLLRACPSAAPTASRAFPPAAVLKNAIDASVATVCWWSVGSAFAYGSGQCGQNGFIGGA